MVTDIASWLPLLAKTVVEQRPLLLIGKHLLAIIDRAVTARHGDIVLACLDGEFTVKILQSDPPALLPSNPDFSPIILQEGQELDIFGVVTFVLHKTRRG